MEDRELEKAMKKPDDKADQAELATINEEVEGKQSRIVADDEYEKMALVSNTDRDDSVIEASSVDEAIARMTVTDNFPERRLKASFEAFEEAELPVLKEEKPGLTHTQYKDMISELWKKSPDNPLNQENQTSQMAEWSLLPKDLLEQISSYLHTSIDLLRFRSVCSSWRSSVLPKPPSSSTSFRFVLNDQNNRILGASFGFYLSKRTIFLIKSPTSPDCWLVKIEEDSSNKIHLLNPLSRYLLNSLPRSFPRSLDLSKFRIFELGQEYVLHHASSRTLPDAANLYMEKVVITWLNGGSHFLLLTIHVSGKLAMFRSVDKEWTIIQEMPSPYDDVIVYNEQFYAVDNTGRTVHVGSNAELKLIANPVFGGDKKYLVESKGRLLLVDMYLSIDTADQSGIGEEFLEHLALYMNERTVRFKVFKLDEETQSWGAVSCLDDLVLFLGEDSSFSASAADLSGCSGNFIFFVDNYPSNENTSEEEDGVLVGGDIGVFDLGSTSIGLLSSYPQYSKMFWPPPAWVSNTSLEIKE